MTKASEIIRQSAQGQSGQCQPLIDELANLEVAFDRSLQETKEIGTALVAKVAEVVQCLLTT